MRGTPVVESIPARQWLRPPRPLARRAGPLFDLRLDSQSSNAAIACDRGHCARPIWPGTLSPTTFVEPKGPRAMTMVKLVVLGCVLAAVGITLKVKLDTPQGPQPLARAIVTTHLQQLRGEMALP